MPAPRLPWIKFWPELFDHEKFASLSDGESWTWVVVWGKASLQAKRWRFASVEHAHKVTGRPIKHIHRLIDVRLLDDTPEGLLIHDARPWQDPSKLASTQREGVPNGDRTVAEASANGDGTLTNNRPNADLEGEGEGDRDVIPPQSPDGEGGNGVVPRAKAIPKPKRERTTIGQDDIEALVDVFEQRYGGRQAVRDEIDAALNHEARYRRLDERLYVRTWLRRDLERRPSPRPANGATRPVARQGVRHV